MSLRDRSNGIELMPETIIGLLTALCGQQRISALSWTIDAALGDAASRAGSNTGLGRALARWPRIVGQGGRTFVGVEAILLRLLRSGDLAFEGSGLSAAFRVNENWIESYRLLSQALEPADRVALQRSAQRLVAIFTMLSKNACASVPKGSATI